MTPPFDDRFPDGSTLSTSPQSGSQMNAALRTELMQIAMGYSDQEAAIPDLVRCGVCGAVETRNYTAPRLMPSAVRELLRYVEELERKVSR